MHEILQNFGSTTGTHGITTEQDVSAVIFRSIVNCLGIEIWDESFILAPYHFPRLAVL
jgi:hypothetical protein